MSNTQCRYPASRGAWKTDGVTKGNLLDGVRFKGGKIITDTVVMRSWTGTVRRIKAEHIDRDRIDAI